MEPEGQVDDEMKRTLAAIEYPESYGYRRQRPADRSPEPERAELLRRIFQVVVAKRVGERIRGLLLSRIESEEPGQHDEAGATRKKKQGEGRREMEQTDQPVDRYDSIRKGPPDKGHYTIDDSRPKRQHAEISDLEALGALEIGSEKGVESPADSVLQQHEREQYGNRPRADLHGRSREF